MTCTCRKVGSFIIRKGCPDHDPKAEPLTSKAISLGPPAGSLEITPAVCSELLASLATLAQALRTAERATDDAVMLARRAGATWDAIGAAVGVSKQAVQRKYAKRADA